MRALVTGGAGFIGSHIAEQLTKRGAEVVVLDNLCLGDEKNLAWAGANDRVEFVEGDVTDLPLIQKLVPGCDWVFHEAALPSVPLSVDKPAETNHQNLTAVLNLLIAARDNQVKRFVFASSSAIYGDSPELPKKESMIPAPLSPYALQKYAGETYASQFYRLYGLETVSLRYFNVFGPRQSFDSPYSGVIAKFCTRALENRPLLVFGDGKQSRDFIYIDNVVQANLLAAEAPADQAAGRFFNIAGGTRITLLDLIDALSELTGTALSPQFEAERLGDVKDSLADISEAQSQLNYSVTVDWKKGLEKTLEFYRNQAEG